MSIAYQGPAQNPHNPDPTPVGCDARAGDPAMPPLDIRPRPTTTPTRTSVDAESIREQQRFCMLLSTPECNAILCDNLDYDVGELGLGVRVSECLYGRGITTLGEVLNCTPETLREINGIGEKSLVLIYAKIYDFVQSHTPQEASADPLAEADLPPAQWRLEESAEHSRFEQDLDDLPPELQRILRSSRRK